MRHLTAGTPGTQSVDKIVASYRQIVEKKGGVMLFSGRLIGRAALRTRPAGGGPVRLLPGACEAPRDR